MRFIWDMLRWYPFYHLLCTFIFSAKILVILKRALNSMGKFWKYFLTLGSNNFETLQPNVTIESLLERYSLLYVHAKNQLDCSTSSTSYVMDNAHLCLGRRKTKWNKTEFCKQNRTSRLIFEWPWPLRNIQNQELQLPPISYICHPIRDLSVSIIDQ